MARIAEYKEILSNDEKCREVIKAELLEIKDKYGDSRRTTIVDEQITYEIDKNLPKFT